MCFGGVEGDVDHECTSLHVELLLWHLHLQGDPVVLARPQQL